MRATRLSKLLLKALRTDSNTIASVPLNLSKLTGQTANFLEVRDTDDTTVLAKINASGVITSAAGTSSGNVVTIDGSQTLTGKTITGAVYSDIKSTTGAVTANATTTYADVTGLSVTVVAGTYKFRCVLPSTVASGTGGIKYCFKYTTTALTSIESTAKGYTASAVAVQHTTTTTDQTDLFTQAAVVILTEIEGTMVVSTGGTIKVQMAQNTSNASNTVALVGGSMQFDRIA